MEVDGICKYSISERQVSNEQFRSRTVEHTNYLFTGVLSVHFSTKVHPVDQTEELLYPVPDEGPGLVMFDTPLLPIVEGTSEVEVQRSSER